MSEATTTELPPVPSPPADSTPYALTPIEAQTARRVACDAFECCDGSELHFAYLCLKDERIKDTKLELRTASIEAMKTWFQKWTDAGVTNPTALAEEI